MKKSKLLSLLCSIVLLSNALCQQTSDENQYAVTENVATSNATDIMNESMDSVKNVESENATEPDFGLGSLSSEIDEKNDSAEIDESGFDDDAFSLPSPAPSSGGFGFKPSRFDDLALPEIFTKNLHIFNQTAISDTPDGQHVYKVPKNKPKKTMTTNPFRNLETSNQMKSEPRSEKLIADQTYVNKFNTKFQVFTNLYDHNSWDIEQLARNLSETCTRDLNMYLTDLKQGSQWALKVFDASGHYNGLTYFENDNWMGSKAFCTENERENFEARKSSKLQIPELEFVVATILITLNPIFPKPKLMQLGQCLPKSCSIEDVGTILNMDPAAMIVQQSPEDDIFNVNGPTNSTTEPSKLTILAVRKVPGTYDLWSDRKFILFGSIILLTVVLIVVASIYETSLQNQGYDFNEKKSKTDKQMKFSKNNIDLNGNNNNNNMDENSNMNSLDKYEMNQINQNDNNNLSENDRIQMKLNGIICQNSNKKDVRQLGFGSRLLLCFAYESNARTILSVESASEDSLTCLHGLRLFSLLWTVLVHTYLQLFAIGENKFDRIIVERTFGYQMIGNATFSVDSFFFISGLLVVLLFLRVESKKKQRDDDAENFNVGTKKKGGFVAAGCTQTIQLFLYRFIRLTPVYLFVIVFTETAMKFTYNRAVFSPTLQDHVTCENYWWRNILYINNFYPLSEICMMWSWYMANDMQFYVFAIIVLIISTRYFKFSVLTVIVTLLSSWVLSILISLHFNYTYKVAEPFESFDVLYDKPWQRIGPYIMGMIAGYILHRVKTPPKIPVIVNVVMWIISLFILFIIVFGVWNGKLSVAMTSLYVSVAHAAWGFALIWITLSCCWGMAKPINSLLSYNGFYPLSRLTYCAYLIHPTVMMVSSFQMEAPIHLQHSIIVTAFLGNAVLSFIAAFFMSLMFEAPTIKMLKLIFRK